MKKIGKLNNEYLIMIGSYARGTQKSESDLDIVRICNFDQINNNLINAKPHVSYVDFNWLQFENLFASGSLFLQHIFLEGKIIKGDLKLWNILKESFFVTNDFSKSIAEYEEFLLFINSDRIFAESYVPYLSNLFKCIKNIGIFKLAQKGQYIFEKKHASITGANISEKDFEILQAANNSFERNVVVSRSLLKEMKPFAKTWYANHKENIKEVLS